MTAAEKIEQLKTDRTLAINAKVATEEARDNALDEDRFHQRYLMGDTITGEIGVNDLIWYYYKEKEYEKGIERTWPKLGDSLWDWRLNYETVYSNALVTTGDDIDGFYPPNENATAATDMNFLSYYLNRNGDETPNPLGGLIGYSIDTLYKLGDSAPTKTSYEDATIYLTEAAALTAAYVSLYGDSVAPGSIGDSDRLGHGVRGRRTCNIEVTASGAGDAWIYRIGYDGTIDEPTFYADTTDSNGFLGGEKTAFLAAFNSLLAYGDTNSDYVNHLTDLKTEIISLEAGANVVFSEFSMDADVADTEVNILSHLSSLEQVVGDSYDIAYDGTPTGDSTLYGIYKYFLTAVGDEAIFETATNLLKLKLGDSLLTVINARYNTIEYSFIGDTYSSNESDFTLLRKWRNTWSKARILKPVSSLISYEAMRDAIVDAETSLSNKDGELALILGNTSADHLQYIPTPSMVTVYPDHFRNNLGVVTSRRVVAYYNGQQHASEYRLYRMAVPSAGASNITNDQWNDSYYYNSMGDTDLDTGLTKLYYTDTDATFINGSKYIYRVRVYDYVNKIGGDTTASLQSPVFDVNITKAFTQVDGDSIINFGEEHTFKIGNYIVVNATIASNGYYLITGKGDSTITVAPALNTGETSGTVYLCKSVIFIRE